MRKRRPDTVYRVLLDDETKLVHVISFGMERVDVSPEQVYNSVNDLPEWMQKGIALLMMTSAEPPTNEVDGVGRRIDETTYWLYG
tara:strand:+ start:1110 stop:1364 length:255 start_codon:yes stop_codon:yes gene_type:complete